MVDLAVLPSGNTGVNGSLWPIVPPSTSIRSFCLSLSSYSEQLRQMGQGPHKSKGEDEKTRMTQNIELKLLTRAIDGKKRTRDGDAGGW